MESKDKDNLYLYKSEVLEVAHEVDGYLVRHIPSDELFLLKLFLNSDATVYYLSACCQDTTHYLGEQVYCDGCERALDFRGSNAAHVSELAPFAEEWLYNRGFNILEAKVMGQELESELQNLVEAFMLLLEHADKVEGLQLYREETHPDGSVVEVEIDSLPEDYSTDNVSSNGVVVHYVCRMRR